MVAVQGQQRLVREPYLARAEALSRQREHGMVGQTERILHRLPLMRNPIEQDLETHEMPGLGLAGFDLNVHHRAVYLQMTGAVPIGFSHGGGVPHGDCQRPQHGRAALMRGQPQAEVRTLELGGRALQQVNHGPVGNHGIGLRQCGRLDMRLPQQFGRVAAQLSHHFRI